MNNNYYVAGTFYDIENQRGKEAISRKNPGTIEPEILENDFVEFTAYGATPEQDIRQLRPNQVVEMNRKREIREYITGRTVQERNQQDVGEIE